MATPQSSPDLLDVQAAASLRPRLIEIQPGRRPLDEQTVDEFVVILRRDGRFLHPIIVREKQLLREEQLLGRTPDQPYGLVCGADRLAAWCQHFGDDRPIPVVIYPVDTPGALLVILEIEENLRRKELSATEKQEQTIRLTGAIKELERLENPDFTEAAPKPTTGRGHKGVTQEVAEKLDKDQSTVRGRVRAAAEKIGEPIDLDQDSPAELERKADKLRTTPPKKAPKKAAGNGSIRSTEVPPKATEEASKPAEGSPSPRRSLRR